MRLRSELRNQQERNDSVWDVINAACVSCASLERVKSGMSPHETRAEASRVNDEFVRHSIITGRSTSTLHKIESAIEDSGASDSAMLTSASE